MKNLSAKELLKVLADESYKNPLKGTKVRMPLECGALIARSVKQFIQMLEYRDGIKELTIMDRGGFFVKDFMVIIDGSCSAVESVVKDIIALGENN